MSGDEIIFVAVLLVRLGVPLLIPRFPLPAILAALVVDAADQTIFQNTTDLDLSGYQGYDKALDVYYLTIAYLSTIRNWTDAFAFRAGQALWYYRLVGVLLFEMTGVRALLILFPNTFEYFFIAYEVVRLRWNPSRLTQRQVVKTAAAIWIFIKLPQEWWIHIAQLDFTDFMKEDVFGVSVDTSWGEAIGENLWFVALIAIVVVAAVVGGRVLRDRLPAPDWGFSMDVDSHLDLGPVGTDSPERQPLVSWYMFEKVALVAMVTSIFAYVLPDNDVSVIAVAIPVAIIIAVNSLASTWLARAGISRPGTIREWLIMTAVNLGTAIVLVGLSRTDDSSVNEAALLFFVLLLTLIVTLFDRYHRLRAARSAASVTGEAVSDPD